MIERVEGRHKWKEREGLDLDIEREGIETGDRSYE